MDFFRKKSGKLITFLKFNFLFTYLLILNNRKCCASPGVQPEKHQHESYGIKTLF